MLWENAAMASAIFCSSQFESHVYWYWNPTTFCPHDCCRMKKISEAAELISSLLCRFDWNLIVGLIGFWQLVNQVGGELKLGDKYIVMKAQGRAIITIRGFYFDQEVKKFISSLRPVEYTDKLRQNQTCHKICFVSTTWFRIHSHSDYAIEFSFTLTTNKSSTLTFIISNKVGINDVRHNESLTALREREIEFGNPSILHDNVQSSQTLRLLWRIAWQDS